MCEGCEPVNLRRTLLSAALLAAALPWARADVLQVTPASLPVDPPPPRVSFTIPKYTLTSDERELLAACLVLEAASQGDRGMRGVMAVIRNRSRGLPELFVSTILREKQFSALNKLTAGRESVWRTIQRAKNDRTWPRALEIVDEATAEDWNDPTRGATHYTRTGEHTPWTRTLARTVTIGRHAFYR
jgi:spore germination cell wall hydrolase CwlJ-like protein